MLRYSVALTPVTGPLRANQRFLRYTFTDSAGDVITGTRSVRERTACVVLDLPGNDPRKSKIQASVFYVERRVRGNVSADDAVPSQAITVEVLPDPVTTKVKSAAPKPVKPAEPTKVKVTAKTTRKPRKAKRKQSPAVVAEDVIAEDRTPVEAELPDGSASDKSVEVAAD